VAARKPHLNLLSVAWFTYSHTPPTHASNVSANEGIVEDPLSSLKGVNVSTRKKCVALLAKGQEWGRNGPGLGKSELDLTQIRTRT